MGVELWAQKDGAGLRVRCGDRVTVVDGKKARASFEVVAIEESIVPFRFCCPEHDDETDELDDEASEEGGLPAGAYALIRLVAAPVATARPKRTTARRPRR